MAETLVFLLTVLSLLSCLKAQDECRCVDRSSCDQTDKFNDGRGMINFRATCGDEEVCCPPNLIKRARLVLPKVAALQGCGVRRFPGQVKPNVVNDSQVLGESQAPSGTFYGELPWMVRILRDGSFICGGTLISSHAVLTAAHCTKSVDANRLSVEVGKWNTTSNDEPLESQKQTAKVLVEHPKFNELNGLNDVSIIFVEAPFNFTEAVDTLCTAESVERVNQSSCFTAGWGKKSGGESYNPVLRKVHLPLLNTDDCQRQLRATLLGQSFELKTGFLCAGGLDSRDTCYGDGGGPLYCPMNGEPDRFATIGIVSWGIGCGKGNPTVFASVPFYLLWINQQLETYSHENDRSPSDV